MMISRLRNARLSVFIESSGKYRIYFKPYIKSSDANKILNDLNLTTRTPFVTDFYDLYVSEARRRLGRRIDFNIGKQCEEIKRRTLPDIAITVRLSPMARNASAPTADYATIYVAVMIDGHIWYIRF